MISNDKRMMVALYEDPSNFPIKCNHRVAMGRPSETENVEKDHQDTVVTDFEGETSSDRVNAMGGSSLS